MKEKRKKSELHEEKWKQRTKELKCNYMCCLPALLLSKQNGENTSWKPLYCSLNSFHTHSVIQTYDQRIMRINAVWYWMRCDTAGRNEMRHKWKWFNLTRTQKDSNNLCMRRVNWWHQNEKLHWNTCSTGRYYGLSLFGMFDVSPLIQ